MEGNHQNSVDYYRRSRKTTKEVALGKTADANFNFQIRKSPCTFSALSSLRSYELPHHIGKSSGGRQGLRSNQEFMHRMAKAHATGISSCLREESLDNKVVSRFNKAFASAWLDHRTVVVGTKCNKLIRVDVETHDVEEIPLPRFASGGQEEEEEEGQASSIDADCGIRSISINSSNTLLATSGSRPSDLAIFEIPSLKPVSETFVGHTDWIFGTAFIDETHVITASRDKTLRVWDVNEGRRKSEEEGRVYSGHESRCRDVKYDSSCSLAASVGADGTLHLWDPSNLTLVKKVELVEGKSREIACAAMDHGLVAVGSQCHISLVDVRCSNNTKYVTSKEPELGIRSVSFHQGQELLTIGGGGGKISFFDLRKDAFVAIPSRAQQQHQQRTRPNDGDEEEYDDTKKERFHLQSRQGFWHPGDLQVFRDFNLPSHLFLPSCYTHSWDPSGTRLFAGGGPTFLLARGCYMSVWS